MRLSKQFIGIAVAVAFATGLATTGTVCAFPSGTQIEYKQVGTDTTRAADAIRAYFIEVVLGELFLHTGL